MTELNRIQPITFVAQSLGITARRIRQFVENGDVPRLGRGLIDFTWCLYFYTGSVIVENWNKKPHDPKILYALGWINILGGDPSSEDIERCVETFKRNGFNRDQALLAIGRAQGLMRNV